MTDFDEGQQLTNSENEKHHTTVSVRKNLENFPAVVVERYELALDKLTERLAEETCEQWTI